MSHRAARRAARIAYHRAAHLDTEAATPGHGPEDCPLDLDIPAYRLDALLDAAEPILRRHAIQEHARRYGRRTVQFTAAEVAALRADIQLVLESWTGAMSRDQRAHYMALSRVLAKLDALD